ncbi:MAG: hypothetical protein MI784_05755, partial [Cytophagales bacterium]|nr:hypothetical protein [Cytophagales bacterium]
MEVESALAYFREKAQQADMDVDGSAPLEAYAELLERIGRPGEAISALIELFPDDKPAARLTP